MNNPATKKAAPSKKAAAKPSGFKETSPLPFERQNYMLLAASFVIIVIGFILMVGTEDIYSFTKMVISPIVVLGGYGLCAYTIMRTPRHKPEEKQL